MTGEEFAKEHEEINKVFGHDDVEFNKRIGNLFERFVDSRIQLALESYEPPKLGRKKTTTA